jgi:hypothetical protein
MLQVLIQAETVNELKSKMLAALHMYEMPQGQLPFPPPAAPTATANTSSVPPTIEGPSNVTEIKGSKKRRTSAEIEADRLAKNAVAKTAGEKIDNNFKAGDEHAMINEDIEDPTAEEEIDLTPPPAATGQGTTNAPVDVATAQGALRQLLAKVGTPKGAEILNKHGAGKITLLTDTGRANFYAEAQKILAGK